MGPLQDRADDPFGGVATTVLAARASMGPLQDRADDVQRSRPLRRLPATLQWGRSKTERMTEPPLVIRRQIRALQWGRSKTERMTQRNLRQGMRRTDRLQWGRSKTERMTPKQPSARLT